MKTASPTLSGILFYAVGFLILLYAAWQRYSLPLFPAFDADTWGYLNPALTALSNQPFIQTHGRSFLYPLFLWTILKATGSFTAIVFIQHLASLATGVVWMLTWSVWSSFLPQGWTRRYIAPVLGLACMALYLLSTETVIFGLRLRPEPIFPLAAMLQIFCLFLFIKLRWSENGKRHALGLILSGSFSMLFALAAYNLKPSWGFAILLPPAVLALAVLIDRRNRSLVAAATPLLAGIFLSGLLLLGTPRLMNWKADESAGLFLPMLLFSVHADITSDYLSEDASLSPEHHAFAQKIKDGIVESRKDVGSYTLLGFNPDYLMFGSRLLQELPRAVTIEDRKAFYFRTYFSSLLRHPMRFGKKWALQFKEAWFPEGKFLFRTDLRLRKYYDRMDAYMMNASPDLRSDVAASYQALKNALPATRDAMPVKLDRAPKGWKVAGSIGAFLYAPLAAGLLLASVLVLFSRQSRWIQGRLAIWSGAIVALAAFFSFVTVAITHSFDIDRYLYLQACMAWLTVACGSVLFCLALEILVFQGLSKESSVNSPKT